MDFLAYDVLDQNRMFEPRCLDLFPNLKAFMCRFEVMGAPCRLPLQNTDPLGPKGPVTGQFQTLKSWEGPGFCARQVLFTGKGGEDRQPVSAAGWKWVPGAALVSLRRGVLSLQALEKIAAYMQSDRFFKMPINNKMALWGNKRAC